MVPAGPGPVSPKQLGGEAIVYATSMFEEAAPVLRVDPVTLSNVAKIPVRRGETLRPKITIVSPIQVQLDPLVLSEVIVTNEGPEGDRVDSDPLTALRDAGRAN